MVDFLSQPSLEHLSLFYVRQNETINKNKIIGGIGNTGWSFAPHLTVVFTDTYDDLKAVYIKIK